MKCIELLLQHGADKTKKDALDEYPVECIHCIPPDGNNDSYKEMIQLLEINPNMSLTKPEHSNYNNSGIYNDDNISGIKTTKNKNQHSSAASNLRINTSYRDDKD